MFTQTWGDPCNTEAEAVASDPRGPGKGRFVGLIGLMASVVPLETERHARRIRHA
jgi:hypothetical protein